MLIPQTPVLRTLTVVLFFIATGLVWAQGTAAGTIIFNQASMHYGGHPGGSTYTTRSGQVEAKVSAVCGLEASPAGTVTQPGQTASLLPGATVYFPYTLSFTGNSDNDVAVALELLTESSLSPTELTLHWDENGNGQLDPGEGPVSRFTALAPGESRDLLAAVSVAAETSMRGDIYIDFVAGCATDPGYSERGNVAHAQVGAGGVGEVGKTAEPAAAQPVLPGESVTYSISFSTNDLAVDNLTVSDTLDARLSAPFGYTDGAVSDAGTGLSADVTASYDAASHTVTWSFATVPAGMNVVLEVQAVVLDDAPAGQDISNSASVAWATGSRTSNTVVHPVATFCAPLVSPNGTVASPAYRETAVLGDTVVFAYEVVNQGNGANSYALSAVLEPASEASPESSYVVLDGNGNGQYDPGESSVSSISLSTPGERVSLLLVVELPESAAAFGDIYVNLVAACSGGNADADNVSAVSLLQGSFGAPTKVAVPSSGTALYPGQALSYSISFDVNDIPVSDVTVTDTLSPYLDDPVSFTNGTVTDPTSGLSTAVVGSYDPASRTLTWNLASVPAGMTVTLDFETGVNPDALGQDFSVVVENTATVSDSGGDLISNVVRHPVRAVELLIEKSSQPAVVTVGRNLSYTLTVINPSADFTLEQVAVTDTLPEVTAYLPGSGSIRYADGSEAVLEPTVNGSTLDWTVASLAPGERLSLMFEVEVLPAALDSEQITNVATASVADTMGRVVAAASADAVTVVDRGMFEARAVLMGRVYVDMDGDGAFSETIDEPVEGVRLYLSTGVSLITDAQGLYTFLDLRPDLVALRVDATTLPPRLLQATASQDKAGLWRVRLQPGLITRQDVPLRRPDVHIAASKLLQVRRGPVELEGRVEPTATGSLVILELESTEALRELTLISPDTVGAAVTAIQGAERFSIVQSGERLVLGNVPAGYTVTLTFESAGDMLSPPEIWWNVR